MLSIVQWVATFSAGLLVSTQIKRFLRKVNDVNQDADAYVAEQVESAVESFDERPLEPYNMGSEQISAALQQILSSKDIELNRSPVYIDAMHNNTKQDYALGSESLNRLLEEILAPTDVNGKKLFSIEPVVHV